MARPNRRVRSSLIATAAFVIVAVLFHVAAHPVLFQQAAQKMRLSGTGIALNQQTRRQKLLVSEGQHIAAGTPLTTGDTPVLCEPAAPRASSSTR